MIPLWLRLAYTAFLCVLVPSYALWSDAGVWNFLWFSDLALFGVAIALWTGSALVASTVAVSVLAFELFWNLSFFAQLLSGKHLSGLTDYMFDASRSRFMRGLSLFHVALPPLIVWLVWRLGYDRRALVAATVLAWVVFPLTRAATKRAHNINWVFGVGSPPRPLMPGPAWLTLLMVGVPVVIYVPTHLLLAALF